MKQNLLKLVVCPECKNKLNLENVQEKNNEITSSSLRCSHCRKEFPTIGSIPRLLPTEQSELYTKTQRSFGFQWLRYHVTDEKEDQEIYQIKIRVCGYNYYIDYNHIIIS